MPTAAAPEPKANMGQPVARIDAVAKVTGAARYPADEPVHNPAYAYLVVSAVARGSVAGIDLRAARAVPGVLDILTSDNASTLKPLKIFNDGGLGSTSIQPLADTKIQHDGQIVAMVVAETFEAAREAAGRVAVTYTPLRPSATFDSPGVAVAAASEKSKKHKDPAAGDAEAAFKAAAVKVDAEYGTPTQHHNPMELFSTTCAWSGDQLLIYEPSQFVYGLKNGVAEQLGIDPANVRVVSRYVGGAFGSKGSVTPRTALVAHAARRLGRPVKLVLPRQHAYSNTTYRAETRHRVRFGAGRDGKIVAYLHESHEVTSRPDSYLVGGNESTACMYSYGTVATKVNLVYADRNTPGFMRSPPETPYMYALETAMDELAVALAIDPVELRRRNDTQHDTATGRPYTSRSLMQCYDEAARAFGWSRRDPRPGSMKTGDWLVGLGCATAAYPAHIAPAAARVAFYPDGHARAQLAAHDLGTGTYTVAAQMVARTLGIPIEAVQVELGDSALPAAPISGGSNVTASVCAVLEKACQAIRARLAQAPNARNLAEAFAAVGSGVVEEYAEYVPPGKSAADVQKLYKGGAGITGGSQGEKLMYAFGAEFVEVHVHARTREIRVPRIVGAFAGGHIMNPRTARSQLMGGMIWGIASALHEATEIDPRMARYVNNDIAEYLVPVNADVQAVDVILVPEVDRQVNPVGIKGLGELGNVGTAAAISNAVFHATGKRVRELPIRVDGLV